jgi:preprotein translocase subunit SecG
LLEDAFTVLLVVAVVVFAVLLHALALGGLTGSGAGRSAFRSHRSARMNLMAGSASARLSRSSG